MLFAKHNFLFLLTFYTASKLFGIGVVDFLKSDSYYRFGLQAQCKTAE